MSLKGDQMRFKEYFLQEKRPFVKKREIDWKKIKVALIWFGVAILTLIVAYPTTKKVADTFSEKSTENLASQANSYSSASQDAIRSFQGNHAGKVHGSLDYLYRSNSSGFGGSGGGSSQNTSMILNRDDSSRSKLNAGVHVEISLTQDVTVSTKSMPIIGEVSNDVFTDFELAIPKGSKVLGVVSFDAESESASIDWSTVQFDGGRQVSFSALSAGDDGSLGVKGKVYSHGAKNILGQTVSNFVGAYASGSMSKGSFGANEGGHKNGLKNAVAETAKNQAVGMGEKLSKERKWIELTSGTRVIAVINQAFDFKE